LEEKNNKKRQKVEEGSFLNTTEIIIQAAHTLIEQESR
jgi:hypothetical protein